MPQILPAYKVPKVSVIIPVYNVEQTLKDCLASLVRQTYDDYEIIVIDNGSIDKTREIIEGFRSNYPRVRYLLEPKRGRGAARNAGIRASSGEIIAMTDSDCIVSENWIAELVKPIAQEDETAVMGFQKDLLKNYWTKNIQKAEWEYYKKISCAKYISFIDTKNFAIKSSVLKGLMFDAELKNCEDVDLYLRLKKTAKIRFNPDIKVNHNHRNSFMSVIKIYFDRGYWGIIIYKKYKKNKELRKQLALKDISFKGFFLFPFYAAYQFIKSTPGRAFFILVRGIAWRAGIIYGMIKK